MDVSTQLVVGPWYAGDGEDIKEEDHEEDEDATAAMLVTVEEDGNIKRSLQITEKQLTNALLANTSAGNKKLPNEQLDMSLQNHPSQRNLSPCTTDGAQTPTPIVGEISRNHTLSPSRFVTNRFLNNSEVSEHPVMKKLSLHTYQIRNKNGSPTAQVTILKDGEEIGLIDEPNDSVSQSTTKMSGINQKSKFQS